MPPIVAMDVSESSTKLKSRLDHEFEDLSDRYRLPVVERDYHKQFASFYTQRLETITKPLTELAQKKWGKGKLLGD